MARRRAEKAGKKSFMAHILEAEACGAIPVTKAERRVKILDCNAMLREVAKYTINPMYILPEFRMASYVPKEKLWVIWKEYMWWNWNKDKIVGVT